MPGEAWLWAAERQKLSAPPADSVGGRGLWVEPLKELVGRHDYRALLDRLFQWTPRRRNAYLAATHQPWVQALPGKDVGRLNR